MNSYGSVSPDEHRKGHKSKVLNSKGLHHLSIHTFYFFSLAGWCLPLLCFCPFNPCVSTYLFIIVDMIISLHSNGHWIMTFHEDLLNRVLGTEEEERDTLRRGENKFPSLIPD